MNRSPHLVIDSIDTNLVARTMDKIHAFQQVIQQAVKPGHDIGIIPVPISPPCLSRGPKNRYVRAFQSL